MLSPISTALLFCILFTLFSSILCQNGTLGSIKFSFSQSSNGAWDGRYLHQSPVLSDGTIVLVGGAKLTAPTPVPVPLSYRVTDIWASSDRGATWRRTSQTNPFISRFAHTATAVGQTILFIGGTNIDGQLFNDVWTSSDYGGTWRQGAWAPFRQRYGHAAALDPDSNTLLITGGCTTSPNFPKSSWRFRNDVFRSLDFAQTWTLPTEAAPWSPRMFHSMTVKQGVFYLAAGQGSDSTGNVVAFRDVWQTINGGSDWTRITAAAEFGPRALALMLSFGANIYLIGGTAATDSVQYPGNSQPKSDLWMSDDSGKTWRCTQTQSNFPARAGASIALVDNQMIIMGGTASGTTYSDVWSTSLPAASTTSSGTIVAGVLGSTLGLLLVLLILRKCGVRMNQQVGMKQLVQQISEGTDAPSNEGKQVKESKAKEAEKEKEKEMAPLKPKDSSDSAAGQTLIQKDEISQTDDLL